MASSQVTVSSTLKTQWQEMDQSTRSGGKFVTVITGGKVSHWSKSTYISQSLAGFNGLESEGRGFYLELSLLAFGE